MSDYTVIRPRGKGCFSKQLDELSETVNGLLEAGQAKGFHLQWTKIFLSDAQNQYSLLVESKLFRTVLCRVPHTVVEQPPLPASKIALLVKTDSKKRDFIFSSLRLSEEEAKMDNSYLQTMTLFEKYLKIMNDRGLDMATHTLRTWIYVKGIDNNYQGMVRARNDMFTKCGMNADTHFIASTGIGGATQTRGALVAMDALAYPAIQEKDKKYLKALDHLNATRDYGVSFERGTRLTLPDGHRRFFISGTASIDRYGHAVYLRDIKKQTERLLGNIEALLGDGEADFGNVKYFVVYLRDASDYEVTEEYMRHRFPTIPHAILHAKVCRPEWLVEMECLAEK